MDAFDESQNTQSQDLFEPVLVNSNNTLPEERPLTLSDIMHKLNSMDKKIETMQAEIKQLKDQQHSNVFHIDTCSFKKRLNTSLKLRFSRKLWLEPSVDVEFKEEVNIFIKQEGFAKDPSVYKQVLSFASSKFSDFRNQLRRKIFKELKEGKRDLQSLSIEEFTTLLMENFVKDSGELSANDAQRVHLCLLLRSFLYKGKLLFPTSSCPADFWEQFKVFYEQSVDKIKQGAEKWQTLLELDKKRVQKRREVLGTEN